MLGLRSLLKKALCKHESSWAENVFWEFVKGPLPRKGGKLKVGYEQMGLLSFCPKCGHAEFIPEIEKWGAK